MVVFINLNSLSDLQRRLKLKERQLDDTESQLLHIDAENFKYGMNIVEFAFWCHAVHVLLVRYNIPVFCISTSDGDC